MRQLSSSCVVLVRWRVAMCVLHMSKSASFACHSPCTAVPCRQRHTQSASVFSTAAEGSGATHMDDAVRPNLPCFGRMHLLILIMSPRVQTNINARKKKPQNCLILASFRHLFMRGCGDRGRAGSLWPDHIPRARPQPHGLVARAFSGFHSASHASATVWRQSGPSAPEHTTRRAGG